MRPRNVLTETNDIRKLMGLPLLKEDSGNSIKDIKKKVLNEDRSFSLGFGNQGGLTIAEEDIDETTEAQARQYKGDGALENDIVQEFIEDIDGWDDGYGGDDIEGMVEEQGYYGEGPEGMATGIDVDGASDIGGGLEPLDQVVTEQGISKVLKQLKKFITPPGPGLRTQDKEYKKFNKEFAKDPRAAVIAKLKQYSPGKEEEINELINDTEMIDNLIEWVNSGTSSWTGPNINESTEDWGFSQYNITLHD